MYKEYRHVTRSKAVEGLCQDMTVRHRARFPSIHVIKVIELKNKDDVKRPCVRQFLDPKVKFPLIDRIEKSATMRLFTASRSSMY
jgi:large subunit ribosomal protein L18Ae